MKLPAFSVMFLLGAHLLPAAFAAETELYNLVESNLGESAPWSGDHLALKRSLGDDGKLRFKLADLPAHRFLKLQLELKFGGGMDFSNIILQGANLGGKPEMFVKERLKITPGRRPSACRELW